MSKIAGTVLASLMVLPLLVHPALASKNIGGVRGGSAANTASQCTTSEGPVWQCPPGDSPENWPLTKCKVMVPTTVCHPA
jgi:hypothetical protein